MAVCIGSWTLRKERGRDGLQGTLDQQPNWTSVAPPLRRVSTLCWGYPEAPLEGDCSSTGSLSWGRARGGLWRPQAWWRGAQPPRAPASVFRACWFPSVSVSFRQEAVGRGRHFWFPAAGGSPAWAEGPRHAWRRVVGWGGGCSEGKGKWARLEPHHPPVFVVVLQRLSKGEDRRGLTCWCTSSSSGHERSVQKG